MVVHGGPYVLRLIFSLFFNFYVPQLYQQVLLRRILAMGILSVCLSRPGALFVTTRWRTKPRGDRDSGSSPYDSQESLVSKIGVFSEFLAILGCNFKSELRQNHSR